MRRGTSGGNRSDAGVVGLMADLWASQRTQALVTAIELGLFTRIAEGKRTVAEIARAAGASEHGTARLLEAITALGYLRKAGEHYALAPVADRYLVRGKELYMENTVEVTRGMTMTWMQLADAVRKGEPALPDDGGAALRVFFPLLVRQIFPINFTASSAAVRSLPAPARRKIRTVLDLGAGAAAWSIPFAKANSKARVTALDIAEVLPTTREYVRRWGVEKQYDYLEGSLRDLKWEERKFDLVIIGHILHGEGERRSRELLKRAFTALNDGGSVLIAELIPNDQRTGPPLPALFALNMMIHVPEGDVFTMAQMREWLKDAGFRRIQKIAVPAPSPLIFATR
jgi:ubiquinone/menaquinone biosynthesis C-methylase UbiE